MGTLAVVELQLRSGLPKDKVVNTYAIAEADGPHVGSAADYVTAISRIYTAVEPLSGFAVGAQMSGALSRAANACAVKLYDITDHLDGSPHGSPYHVGTFTLPAALAADPMPEEVAYAVTLESLTRADQFVEVPDGADPGAAVDRPRQRHTGRVYLGPWNSFLVAADANGMSRPTATMQQMCREAVKRACNEVDAIGADVNSIGIWSRVDRAIRGVHMVRTDDAWDTQRRRGASPVAITRVATAELVPEVELGA